MFYEKPLNRATAALILIRLQYIWLDDVNVCQNDLNKVALEHGKIYAWSILVCFYKIPIAGYWWVALARK
jgi:hypothetical protein